MKQAEFRGEGFETIEKTIVDSLKQLYSISLDQNTSEKEKQFISRELDRILSLDGMIHTSSKDIIF